MESPPSGTNGHSASREISKPPFMEPEDSVLGTDEPATSPTLSWMNAVHTFPSYLINIRINIILLSTPKYILSGS